MAVGADPGVAIYVSNLAEVRRALRKYAPDLLPVLRNNIKGAITGTVVPRVKEKVPRRSDRAADSVRSTASGNTFYIVAGNASAPYFGWLDFGGHLRAQGGRRNDQFRPVIKRGRYVYPAAAESQPELASAVERAVDRTTDAFNRS